MPPVVSGPLGVPGPVPPIQLRAGPVCSLRNPEEMHHELVKQQSTLDATLHEVNLLKHQNQVKCGCTCMRY